MRFRKPGTFVMPMVILLFMCSLSIAEVPEQINFQGYMTDKNETPVTDTSVLMVFRIYNQADGTLPPLWEETQTIEIINGIYEVSLGGGTTTIGSFDSTLFESKDLWLEVVANGEVMSPRQKLTSVAFSLHAGDADTLNGMDSTSFAQSVHVNDTNNPHSVTAAQVGALTQTELNAHGSVSSAHHEKTIKTTSFSELKDSAADSQIPDAITRDIELEAGLREKADTKHNHGAGDIASGTLSTSRFSARSDLSSEGYLDNAAGDIAQNNTIIQTDLNADLLDGMHANDVIEAAANYVRTPISSLPYSISSSGSYYIASDLSTAGGGITVTASNVTIDLMGFTLSSTNPSSWSGVLVNSPVSNITIKNGTITNFGYGVIGNDNTINGVRLNNIRVTNCAYFGIYLWGYGNTVENCLASGNTFDGIYLYSAQAAGTPGNMVKNCISFDNQGTGISVTTAKVTGCSVFNNQGSGIKATRQSMITNNLVNKNNLSGLIANAGIYVNNNCQVKGNAVNSNMVNNIYTHYQSNIIEENLLTDSIFGIKFNQGGCFYANNRASGHTTDYGGDGVGSCVNGGGNVSF